MLDRRTILAHRGAWLTAGVAKPRNTKAARKGGPRSQRGSFAFGDMKLPQNSPSSQPLSRGRERARAFPRRSTKDRTMTHAHDALKQLAAQYGVTDAIL